METLFIYIVKVNIALAVFYMLYKLLFSKDTFIRLRRYYFLSAIIFSLAYPLITVSALGSLINLSKEEGVETETSIYIGEISMGEFIVDDVEEVATPLDWIAVTKNILLVGVFLLILRFVCQLFSIISIKLRSEKRSLFGYLFYHLKDEITPFSFFNWIFIHTETHTEKELKQILLHEQTHASQWHSLDILLVEMLRIAFWWNPVVWLMKRDMAINLEYLADQAVLQEGVETIEYQYHLLQLTYHETAVQIVNNFNVSQLKQRIIMMNTNKTPMRKLAKYLSILPLVLLLITANSMYAQVNEVQEPVKEIAPPPPPPPPPAPPQEQEQPSYRKNLIAIMGFIKTEMKYPQIAKEKGIQGRVLAGFTIEKDGTVTNPKIVEGVDPSLDKEAIRIIDAMPKWEPFVQDGIASKTEYTIPFHFDLDGKDKSNEISTIGFKVVNAEGDKEIVIRAGSMKDNPTQTLAEKFGDSSPLIIVDDVKMTKGFGLNSIEPKNIESVAILKDELALEKYGEEGKDGVVLVKLKDKAKFPTTAGKISEIRGEDEVIVRGFGSMKDKPVQTLAEKFGTDKPIYIVDGKKTENIDNIDPKNIESISVLKNESAISKYGDEGKNGVIEVTTKAAIAKSALLDAARKKLGGGEIEEIFVVVEDQPQFPGGPEALMQYLGENIKYPKEAHEKKIEGRVIVNFVVNTNGSISDVSVVRGIAPVLDAEAVRVISEMPNWKPGMQRGQAVRVRYTLPIVFSLKSNEETTKPTDDVFVVVEKQPEFPGGMSAMMKYLGENTKYPVEAQKNKIEGRVIVNFVVNKDGSLSDMSIVRGQDPSLDAEAIRVIAAMPNWKPGMHRGEAVKVRFTLPIVFRLKADEETKKDPLDDLEGTIKEVKVE